LRKIALATIDYAMGKPWVLDTGTKGTGAEMVPLEKVLRKPASKRRRVFVPRRHEPDHAPEPQEPPKFKVVDVMTQQVLAEDADAPATVEVLEKTRSVVDVRIYIWEPRAERWRLLNHRDHKLLWGFRGHRAELERPRPG
jgi:hypothetical protein